MRTKEGASTSIACARERPCDLSPSHLRREGLVPCVVLCHTVEPQILSVPLQYGHCTRICMHACTKHQHVKSLHRRLIDQEHDKSRDLTIKLKLLSVKETADRRVVIHLCGVKVRKSMRNRSLLTYLLFPSLALFQSSSLIKTQQQRQQDDLEAPDKA